MNLPHPPQISLRVLYLSIFNAHLLFSFLTENSPLLTLNNRTYSNHCWTWILALLFRKHFWAHFWQTSSTSHYGAMESWVLPEWIQLPYSTGMFSELHTLKFPKNIVGFWPTYFPQLSKFKSLQGWVLAHYQEGILTYLSHQISIIISGKLMYFLKLYFPYMFMVYWIRLLYWNNDNFIFIPIEQTHYWGLKHWEICPYWISYFIRFVYLGSLSLIFP